MKEEQMPTAFDLICGKEELFCEGPMYSESGYTGSQVQQFMIEFARLHVEAALKAASQKATLQKEGFDYRERSTGVEQTGMIEYRGHEGYDEDPIVVSIEKDSILNAYPPENIK